MPSINPLYDFPKDEQPQYALPVEPPVVETSFVPATNEQGQPLKKVYITGKPEPKLVAVDHDPWAVSDPATGFTGEMKTGPKPERKNWMIEPDLMSQGMSEGLPEGSALNEAGVPYWKDTGEEIKIIRRPGVLPFVRTPDGVELAMPKIFDAAGNMMGGIGGAAAPANSLGSFGGRLAKTADLKKLEVAEGIDKLGLSSIDANVARQATGWHKDVDGNWKFEISDHNAKVNPEALPKTGTIDLEKYLDHPELYEAYPDLKKLQVGREINPTSKGSYFNGTYGDRVEKILTRGSDPISINKDSTALHEIQHAIQQREGFSQGSNPLNFMTPEEKAIVSNAQSKFNTEIKALRNDKGLDQNEIVNYLNATKTELDNPSSHNIDTLARISAAKTFGIYDRLKAIVKDGLNADRIANNAYQKYRTVGGEVEARNVQTRMNMTPIQRMDNSPFATADIPKDKIIVKNINGKNVSMASVDHDPFKVAPTFYSAVEHAVNNISQPKMTGEQWLGTLANKPGVKPEELSWTGLNDFLAERKGVPVTKQELQDFVTANKVELKDVTKGVRTPEGIAATKAFTEYSNELAAKYGLNPEQNLGMYGRIKNMDKAEVAKYDELQKAFLAAGDVAKTKYHSYQLPGGENYREHLLTMPENGQGRALFKRQDDISTRLGEIRNEFFQAAENVGKGDTSYQPKLAKLVEERTALEAERKDVLKKLDETNKSNYQSSHWDEPNILAHVRMNDRWYNDPTSMSNVHPGKRKALHLEEIQSDWHQQGRDIGYKSGKIEDLKPLQDAADTARRALSAATEKSWRDATGGKAGSMREAIDHGFGKDTIDAVNKFQATDKAYHELGVNAHQTNTDFYNAREAGAKGVPDAPFKKNWHELALKRMIREAAEKGYDRLSWTPGEAQAARYDLSKQVDNIKVEGVAEAPGVHFVDIKPKTGEPINLEVENGKIREGEHSGKSLADVIGKEMAEKILKVPGGTNKEFAGENLRIGGEGMKGFYDQIIPKSLEKIGKEHGVKVKQGEIKGSDPDKFHGERKFPVHYIDIPQSMKDAALRKGQPMFSVGSPFSFMPVDHDPFENEKSK